MTSDIFLTKDGIEAVTTNEEALAVTTGEDKDPDIELTPNSASLVLGGGAGDHSDGDVRLLDRPDGDGAKPRVHLTGGAGATDPETRVRIDGSDGTAKLGSESADDPDIELRPGTADVSLGGGSGGDSSSDGGVELLDGDGRQRVFMESGGSAPRSGDRTDNAVYLTAGGSGVPRPDGTEGDAGQLHLGQVGDDFADATITLDGGTAQLSLGSDVESGVLKLYRQDLLRTVSVDGHEAEVLVGSGQNAKGEAGSLALADAGDTRTVALESDDGGDGGSVSVAHESGPATVLASGGAGRLRLGNVNAGSDGVAGRLAVDNDAGARTATLAGSAGGSQGGAVMLGHPDGTETASIEGGSATLTLGDGAAGQDGVAGGIDLIDAGDEPTVDIESERASGGAGAALSTAAGTTTADVDAGTGTMALGGTGVGGTLALSDGKGLTVELTVEDGVLSFGLVDDSKEKVSMELEPSKGIFSIRDGDGDAAFQIDTQAKTIKKGKKYRRGVVGHGP